MFSLRSSLPAVLAATTAIAITACGSSTASSTSGAGSGPSQAQIQRFQADAIKFTDCVRNHGIANFPDPPTQGDPSSGRTWKNAFANQSPGFVSAAHACEHFMPRAQAPTESSTHSPAQTAAMLAFARCIRSHGFPNFPDPTNAGITHEMIAAAEINLHQPAVVQAADACVGVTRGLLNRAAVARFIAGH